MSARTPLEHRLAKKVGQAIKEHNLIQDGDRIMVGLSGGKDSWALIHILEVLRQRAPINFSIVAVNVDSGYTGYRHDLITKACNEHNWELRIDVLEVTATSAPGEANLLLVRVDYRLRGNNAIGNLVFPFYLLDAA